VSSMRLPNGSRQKKRGRFGIGVWSLVSTPAASSLRRQPSRSSTSRQKCLSAAESGRHRIRKEVQLELDGPGLEPDQLLVDERGRDRLLDEAEDAAVERPHILLPPARVRRRNVLETPDRARHAASLTAVVDTFVSSCYVRSSKVFRSLQKRSAGEGWRARLT
jgi:hypothetical protein